jgi:L-ornithine N5-monooxygenase
MMKQDFRKTVDADVVGIGFGPAAISFACAVADAEEEHGCSPAGSVTFFEKASRPGWQPELLLPGTDINHHVFRDLVTPRNPRSRFSFAMYLKEKGRLHRFGVLGRPASRLEWSDYVCWTAERLAPYVHYDEPVVEILPGLSDGALTHVDVVTSNGVTRTRNLVVSSGVNPRIPALLQKHLGSHVFHTSEYLTRVGALRGASFPKRWLVIGSGQSASEATVDLLGRGDEIVVRSLHRSSGFKLTQLGHFPNLTFSPEQVDYFHSLDLDGRQRLFAEVKATNYSGIDPDESQKLFSVVYEGEIEGRESLKMVIYSEAKSVTKTPTGYTVTVRDIFSNKESTFEVDGIVLATGYDQPRIPPLFAPLVPWLSFNEDGAVTIDRDYRVKLAGDTGVNIFMNGLSERTHGISDGQSFSLMALRSERILNAIVALREN